MSRKKQTHSLQAAKTLGCVVMLALMLISLSGCKLESAEDRLYGNWEFSTVISGSEFKKLSEGIQGELVMNGTQSYHKGGKYSGDGEMTMRFGVDGVELMPPLRFYFKDAGEWTLHANGKELVTTSHDGFLAPLDESTEAFLESSPETAAALKPVKGQTSTARILSISDGVMTMQEDQAKFIINMRRIP
jgi:hypothetical protein